MRLSPLAMLLPLARRDASNMPITPVSTMLKILRSIWWLLGLGAALQYLYFAICMIGWRLGEIEWPHIGGVWMFLAVSGAFIVSMERLFPSLRDRTT